MRTDAPPAGIAGPTARGFRAATSGLCREDIGDLLCCAALVVAAGMGCMLLIELFAHLTVPHP